MTNNPTIDGVSLLPCPFCGENLTINYLGMAVHTGDGCILRTFYPATDIPGVVDKWNTRALLDADHIVDSGKMVEPFAYYFRFAGYVTTDGPQGWRTEIETERPTEFLFDDGRVKDFTPLYKVAPEVAALQSTVAQLQARLAELESGRGEPVMKLEAERLWGGAGEYAVSFVKAGWLDECRRNGGEFLLFTAPPAPVAVVDENAAFEKWAHGYYGVDSDEELNFNNPDVRATKVGWVARACLDATAALNGGTP